MCALLVLGMVFLSYPYWGKSWQWRYNWWLLKKFLDAGKRGISKTGPGAVDVCETVTRETAFPSLCRWPSWSWTRYARGCCKIFGKQFICDMFRSKPSFEGILRIQASSGIVTLFLLVRRWGYLCFLLSITDKIFRILSCRQDVYYLSSMGKFYRNPDLLKW